MRNRSVGLVLAVSAVLMSACSAAEMEQFRADMTRIAAPVASDEGGSAGGLSVGEAAARSTGVRTETIVNGRIGTTGEIDRYSFDGREGQYIVIYAHGIGEGAWNRGDLSLASTPEGPAIVNLPMNSFTPNLTDRSTDRVQLRETGTYTIRVNGIIPGAYRFLVREVDTRPEERSASIRLGEIVESTAEQYRDIDEFQFHGTKGQRLDIHTQGLGEGAWNRGTLYLMLRPDAPPLANMSIIANPYLTDRSHGPITLKETGTYTVRIDSSLAGKYRFQIKPVS